MRECIERKKTMLLEREYDEGHDDDDDDDDEAVYEEKRREIFAFNVVKDVADIRVSFLTRAIASVRLSRRCGALEGLIAGRTDPITIDDEDEKGNERKELNAIYDDEYYRSMNDNIDTIEEEDEGDDNDEFEDNEYVSW